MDGPVLSPLGPVVRLTFQVADVARRAVSVSPGFLAKARVELRRPVPRRMLRTLWTLSLSKRVSEGSPIC